MPGKESWSLREKLHFRRSKPKIADGDGNQPSSPQRIPSSSNTSGSQSIVNDANSRPGQATSGSSERPSQPDSSIEPPTQGPIDLSNSTSQPAVGSADAPTQEAPPAKKVRAIDIPPELLWDQAYDEIKKEEPKLVASYETVLSHELGGSESPSENVIQESQVERRSQMDKLLETGLEKTARLSKVEQGIGTAISVVMSVKSAITSGLSSVPVAAVAWTSVCVALEVFQNPIDQMSSNRDGIVTVTCKMKWYSSLSKLLYKEASREDEHFTELRGLLAERVLDLYKVLLKYIIKSICTHYRNQALVFLRGLAKLDDWSGNLDRVTKAEESVRTAASELGDRQNNIFLGLLVDIHMSKEENKIMQKCFVADMTREIENIQAQTDKLLAESWQWVLGTSEWQEFIAWDESNEHSLFWLRGDAGKGKTMLLIGIVNELTAQLNTHFRSHLSYFFCKGGDSNLNTATAVLRGLIWMLLRQDKSLLRHLAPFKDLGPALFEDRMAFYNLAAIFRAILQDDALGRIYLVVDGLDECQREQPGLLQLLDLVNETSENSKVKWILSSRNEPDILEALEDEAGLQLSLESNTASVSDAVNAYIRYKMTEVGKRYDQKLRRNKGNPRKNEELQKILQDIQTELRHKSDGTFLWVALVVRELMKCGPDKALEKVQQMPRYLNGLYAHFITEMISLDDAEECKAVLLIMVNAYRPLHLSELVALASLSDLNAHDESVRHCGLLGLQGDDIVYFVHQSAKDYLVQDQSSSLLSDTFPQGHGAGHRVIVFRSLELFTHLDRDIFALHDPGFDINHVQIPNPDPLESLRYSCCHWVDHLCHIETIGTDTSLLEDPKVDHFWRGHFLHWLEALSLMRRFPAAIFAMVKLTELLAQRILPRSSLLPLMEDFHRFALSNRFVIESFPLQVYASALIFAPRNCLTRDLFKDQEPEWITTKPLVEPEWDACLQTLYGGQTSIFSIAASPDGALLASAGNDRTLKVWESSSGSCLHTLTGHTSNIVSVAFSQDGSLLASGSLDGAIKIWNVQKGECFKTLQGHRGVVNTVVFSLNGRLASSSSDRTMKIWDTESGNSQSILVHQTDAIVKAVFSHDGKRIATGSESGIVAIWDAHSGECLKRILGHTGKVISVVFTPEGNIASVATDQSTRIWDSANGRILKIYKAPGFVRSAAWGPNGQIAFGLEDGGIEVWKPETGECLTSLKGHVDWTDSLLFTSNGWLVSGSRDGSVKIWDSNKPSVETLERHRWFTFAMCACPNGLTASAANDGTVKIWGSDGVCLKTLKTGSWRIQSIAFSTDGRRLASFHFGTMKIWDWRDGECVDILKWDRVPKGHALSANGKPFVPLSEGRFTGMVQGDHGPFEGWAPGSSRLPDTLEVSGHRGHGYELDETGEWITWKGHNVLWLPLMHRPLHFSFYIILPDGLVVGSRSRRTLRLTFSSTKLPL
ncbi:uncharacterized protein N7459_009469 [Penicillium hispanicum]|uniref:uncharacterized protein n=1 Tax=Penicillium hispanicum TaxID=1080232 RepID=UPI0025419E96|nr:uncharacterized protein N7459_009469 [Penicillium hispanicum]KAJ5570039.1 hypothetical protein N7459_009469 [Penicillium hispanicum]